MHRTGNGLRALAWRQCLVMPRAQLQKTFVRTASKLYPTTSKRWDNAMLQAESIVGESSNFSNLQRWVSGEFNNITKYMQRLIGTNHPMLETAKRCTYISEGRMGSAQARGLTVVLTAKAIESLSQHTLNGRSRDSLIRNQMSLAEMTEVTYSAYMMHRGVMDLKQHGLEAVDLDASVKVEKGIHYGNKVSVLLGDFLLAYVMRGLGDLLNSKAVDLVASAITQFMEGEFLLIDDWRSKNYMMSDESRDFSRWERRSYSTIGCLQGNTCQAALVLANVNGKLQEDARLFGTNLGMAWQAHTELQPFLKQTYEPIELPEMTPYPAFDLNCLPVLLFLRNANEKKGNFRLMLNELKAISLEESKASRINTFLGQHRHQESVDYSKLHEFVLNDGQAVEETYKIIRGYSQTAISHLDSFPPSDAKNVLRTICESLKETY